MEGSRRSEGHASTGRRGRCRVDFLQEGGQAQKQRRDRADDIRQTGGALQSGLRVLQDLVAGILVAASLVCMPNWPMA